MLQEEYKKKVQQEQAMKKVGGGRREEGGGRREEGGEMREGSEGRIKRGRREISNNFKYRHSKKCKPSYLGNSSCPRCPTTLVRA